MTEDRLPLAELLAKAEDGDFLRSVAEAMMQLLMETDVDGLYANFLTRTDLFPDQPAVLARGQ